MLLFTVYRFTWEKCGASLGRMDSKSAASFQILMHQGRRTRTCQHHCWGVGQSQTSTPWLCIQSIAGYFGPITGDFREHLFLLATSCWSSKQQVMSLQADWLLKQMTCLMPLNGLWRWAGLSWAETDQLTPLQLSLQLFHLVVKLWCKLVLKRECQQRSQVKVYF